MSGWLIVPLIIVLAILAFSFFSTKGLMKEKTGSKEMDSSLPEDVQDKPYLANPIFLAYGIFFVLLIVLTLFFVFS
ncbi:hypothetical protein [Cytobacillus purgationiresistens]|uniref:Quinol-cytochrome oxidoreductase complex cytochrome b subunit n=1 Tax=Cytobacillus purgationiresistens TaxID=863449 RepID=A0ABU0AIS4_9BACI|nr:hypothetical protein [Cytobacillus purgationiresistens]MDQ0270667.1 quinol-cytochrome oxidoreductase complex cytochrome b subunit [Cytobacillus purgationiresistens]